MRNKIILIMIITISSLSLKSQVLGTLNDTNVIYCDYVPDVVVTNPYTDTLKIDFNQDGINDVQFYFHYYPATSPYVKTLNSNCKVAFWGTANNNDTLTSSSLGWGSGDLLWQNTLVQNRLGVRITDGVNYYYGWVHVSYSNPPQALTIDKYAFCKIANYPFLYGQTTISTGINEITPTDSTQVSVDNAGNITVQSGKLINSVTLTSVAGTVVALQNNINSYTANISTAGIAHGTYIVQVQFADLSTYTKQIVL